MSEILIYVSGHAHRFDVVNMALLFLPGSRIVENVRGHSNTRLYSKKKDLSDGRVMFSARLRYNGKVYMAQKTAARSNDEADLMFIKQTVFRVFSRATGIRPPWGILTGIRPMAIYEKLIGRSNEKNVYRILTKDYYLTSEKADLLRAIYHFRTPVYDTGVRDKVSLYISIPFCPSKCKYCSFVSSSVEKTGSLLAPYLSLMQREIIAKLEILRKFRKTVSTVYIGGGTPGVLSEKQMEKLFHLILRYVPDPEEFCFEIGRPETVTKEKLDLLAACGVDRLCINCQTLNDDVLRSVGRRHTAGDFLDAVSLAKQYPFKTINVDLIAGLPDESIESHLQSLDTVISLGVENITVHTLSIKRASTWTTPQSLYDPKAAPVVKMLARGHDILREHEYYPYYLYRQKSTLSNGENVGYAKPDHIGRYNIYMMEDVQSVIGIGAGASTKMITASNGRIERFCNMKYPLDYIQHPEKTEAGTDVLLRFLEREQNEGH